MTRRRSSGFSVLDAVLVVAALALLASIAVPEYQARELRGRIAERDALRAAIVQAVSALEPAPPRSATPAAPTAGEGAPPAPAIVAGTWNPPTVPGGARGAWVAGKGGWARIPGVAPGSTWCSYQFVLDEERSPARLLVASDCDIDGDGVHAVQLQVFTRSGKGFVLAGESAPPPSIF